MKILMINKFLYPNGGSETYMFGLGQQLEKMGHEVQYFGMEHEGRCVGNRVEAYTSSMDFHSGSRLAKLTYPLKTIYSSEARQKLRLVLDDFRPDVIHLNNFNYQLTPSVLLEADKWRRKSGQSCRILYTAHDHQLVCPDHLCYQGIEGHPCEECLGGHYVNCIKHRCIHGSRARSIIGCAEATFWKWKKVYRKLSKPMSELNLPSVRRRYYPVKTKLSAVRDRVINEMGYAEVLSKYEVKPSTFHVWLHKYKSRVLSEEQHKRLSSRNYKMLYPMTDQERAELETLRQEVEKQKILVEAHELMLELARERLHVDVKKNYEEMLLAGLLRDRKNGEVKP